MSNIDIIKHEIVVLADKIFQDVKIEKDTEGNFTEFSLPWNRTESIKKELNEEDLYKILSEGLCSIFAFNSRKNKAENRNVHLGFYDRLTRLMLIYLCKYTTDKQFKSVVSAFEDVVRTEGVYGDTDFYRSLLLYQIGFTDLKKFKNKISYICDSEILNSKENIIDRNNCSKSADLREETADFYARFISVAWVGMSKFHDIPNIVNNYYPDDKTLFVSSFDIVSGLHLAKTSCIDLSKVNKEIILKKFDIDFLIDMQNELTSGKLKKYLDVLIGENVNDDKKIEIMLNSLASLKMKSFNDLRLTYPGIFEKINYEDVKKMSIDIVQVNEHEEKIEEKGYKKYKLIDTQNSENKRNDIKENIWKIVSYIKSSEEKKALTKIMKENTKRKSKKTMKRI
jgi:hypothetical protein